MENENASAEHSKNGISRFVIFLIALATLLSAYSSWVGATYGSKAMDARLWAASDSMKGFGQYQLNAMLYNQDVELYRRVVELVNEYEIAAEFDNFEDLYLASQKIVECMNGFNAKEFLTVTLKWDTEEYYAAFDTFTTAERYQEFFDNWIKRYRNYESAYVANIETFDYEEVYFKDAYDTMNKGAKFDEEATEYGDISSKYGTITPIYSVVLFLLAIIQAFESLRKKKVLVVLATLVLIATTAYMFIFLPFPV